MMFLRWIVLQQENGNPNRGMQGDPRDSGSFIFLCCLACAYRIYSCLGVVLLFFSDIPGGYLFAALEGLEQEGGKAMEDDP